MPCGEFFLVGPLGAAPSSSALQADAITGLAQAPFSVSLNITIFNFFSPKQENLNIFQSMLFRIRECLNYLELDCDLCLSMDSL
jgi:hypothetical protein